MKLGYFYRLLTRPDLIVDISKANDVTPLHVASLKGHFEWVEHFLKKKRQEIDIDCQDNCGQTPLQLASRPGK